MQVKADFHDIEASGNTAGAAQSKPLAPISASVATAADGVTSLCGAVPPITSAPSKQCAFSYLRTSSAANVGGDSDHRQRDAINRYAATAGIEIVGEFYDGAVSGADPVETRQGFNAMLAQIEASDVRLVIVEDCSRLARSVLVSELAITLLVQRGVRVLTCSGDDLTETDDPGRIVMRQVGSAFAEYEKRRLVLKLKHARDAKRAATGRCEGRPRPCDAAIAAAKELRAAAGLSQRAIAAKLAEMGYVSVSGKIFSAGQIGRMLAYA